MNAIWGGTKALGLKSELNSGVGPPFSPSKGVRTMLVFMLVLFLINIYEPAALEE